MLSKSISRWRFIVLIYLLYTNARVNNIQLLDETEQNIVIYQWRADQLFGEQINYLICSPNN